MELTLRFLETVPETAKSVPQTPSSAGHAGLDFEGTNGAMGDDVATQYAECIPCDEAAKEAVVVRRVK